MTITSYSPARSGAPSRTIAGVVMAFLIATFGGLLLPSVAHAADAPVDALEYSADGVTWGDTSLINWSQDILIPGGTNTTIFYVRNASDEAGVINFYGGDYTISPAMQVYLRVDVNGIQGKPATATGNATAPGVSLNSVHLAPGASAKVAFVIGMPSDAGNESMWGEFTPGWNVDFTADSTNPGTGTGSLGSLSAGSLDFGSLSAGPLDFGSLNSGSTNSGSTNSGSLGSSSFVSSAFAAITVGSADFGS
ncbi:hypothetical protein ACFRFQ_28200 [Rhodococcus sp. NPDC056743]|uniref:hypothetical protein n=1 Tax=Rhodococcus sp. NPDC056743 TaxID=3345934 RepID=UPI0036701E49